VCVNFTDSAKSVYSSEMAHLAALACMGLVAVTQGATRDVTARQQVGECAKSQTTAAFIEGKLTGALPSAAVKQAETDVTGADLITIEYKTNYKILTEQWSKEIYILTQCGTTPPSDADLKELTAKHPDYLVKHFTIPLQLAASSSSVQLAFFEALGVQDRIKYVNAYASGVCWQKAVGCNGIYKDDKTHADEVDAIFMDCGYNRKCGNVNGQKKSIHISASQDPGPLRSAEHIKFIAAFFNKEELATQLFAKTVAAYTAASTKAPTKPVVAWISFAAKSQWSAAKFVLSQASYKLKMVTDAGGANVGGAAVKTKIGANMEVVKASTGNTYNLFLSKYGDDKAKASEAFFGALSDVDIIIDETYAAKPKTYDFNTFLTTVGLKSDSTLKFIKNKKVLRIDGLISEADGLDWYESRVAHPDWAVGGLSHYFHDDDSKPAKFFRNIAAGEKPQVLTKAMCKSNLQACDAKVLPAPIGMMVGKIISGAFSNGLGVVMLLVAVVMRLN